MKIEEQIQARWEIQPINETPKAMPLLPNTPRSVENRRVLYSQVIRPFFIHVKVDIIVQKARQIIQFSHHVGYCNACAASNVVHGFIKGTRHRGEFSYRWCEIPRLHEAYLAAGE